MISVELSIKDVALLPGWNILNEDAGWHFSIHWARKAEIMP
jgi:hypothetical protein